MATAGKSAFRLFVSNLPWTANSQKLKNYFSKFGQINSANIVFDRKTGLSRGYGFVIFNNQIGFEAAKQAKKHIIDGSAINIEQVHN